MNCKNLPTGVFLLPEVATYSCSTLLTEPVVHQASQYTKLCLSWIIDVKWVPRVQNHWACYRWSCFVFIMLLLHRELILLFPFWNSSNIDVWTVTNRIHLLKGLVSERILTKKWIVILCVWCVPAAYPPRQVSIWYRSMSNMIPRNFHESNHSSSEWLKMILFCTQAKVLQSFVKWQYFASRKWR